MARVRSPNYPAMSLPAALDRIRTVHTAEGRNAASREAIAKALGFGGLNGASATMLSALGKYGLIEPVGEGEAKITDLAMSILFPHDPEERQGALEQSAFRPVLFAKLREKWPERPPSDDSLRSYLHREGFSSSAVDQVIQFYRETLEIANPRVAGHDSSSKTLTSKEDPIMTPSPAAPASQMLVTPPSALMAGKPFTIGFDGTMLTGTIAITSVRDIDRLMNVLRAQKAAFEAMQEFEDDDALDTAKGEDEETYP
ncbi:hypothetical protein L2449_25530 [Mesorhizobium muleiense]|uniref:hypothetical protein n=1 Tax=Mesorhizobium muleiense TaxID=1004279 RepID=UPI001F3DE1B1|nr:hypothetical protein [Mesorhizobium muleiense]MCF6120200.1 hypothetical protein [Mesorhizobium muleiense]